MMQRPVRKFVFSFVLSAMGLLAVVAIPRTPATAQQASVIEDIRKAWQQRQEKVKSARIEYKTRETITKGFIKKHMDELREKDPVNVTDAVPALDVAFDATGRLLLDGVKACWSKETQEMSWKTGKYGPLSQTVVFDGKVEKQLRKMSPGLGWDTPNGPLSHGRISPVSESQYLRTPPLTALLMAFRPMVKEIRMLNLDTFKVTGRKDVLSGVSCIELATGPEGTPGARFWVDPARDYVIVRVLTVGGPKLMGRTDIRYRQDASIGWVPESWEHVFQRGNEALQKKSSAVVVRLEIGEPLANSEFNLEFPPNTMVVDTVRNEKYLVKPNSEKRIVPPEDAGKSYEKLVNSQPGEARGGPRPWPLWPWFLGAAICSAAVGLAFWWHRRTSRTASPDSDTQASPMK
jgi:hypothetical protein